MGVGGGVIPPGRKGLKIPGRFTLGVCSGLEQWPLHDLPKIFSSILRPQSSGDERNIYKFIVSPNEEGSVRVSLHLDSTFTSFKEDENSGIVHIHGNLCSEHHAHFAS